MPTFAYMVAGLVLLMAVYLVLGAWLQRRRRNRAPRITSEEFNAFRQRLALATLPAAWVTLQPATAFAPAGSRIGGRPYFDTPRQKWPVRGEDKVPMLFLCQINFAELPELEDFPSQGLLQLFVRADARGEIESPERKTDRVIRWFPDPTGRQTLDLPPSLTQQTKRRTFSARVIHDGLTMVFERGNMEADPNNWPFAESYPNLHARLAESDALRKQIWDWEESSDKLYEKSEGRSWVGGHPKFVQEDVRHEPRLRKLNRVLLHICSDGEDIRLGDAGELNLMISRKDLRNLDFDQAYCTWDGS